MLINLKYFIKWANHQKDVFSKFIYEEIKNLSRLIAMKEIRRHYQIITQKCLCSDYFIVEFFSKLSRNE